MAKGLIKYSRRLRDIDCVDDVVDNADVVVVVVDTNDDADIVVENAMVVPDHVDVVVDDVDVVNNADIAVDVDVANADVDVVNDDVVDVIASFMWCLRFSKTPSRKLCRSHFSQQISNRSRQISSSTTVFSPHSMLFLAPV